MMITVQDPEGEWILEAEASAKASEQARGTKDPGQRLGRAFAARNP